MPFWCAMLQPSRTRLALCCLAERGFEVYHPQILNGRGPEPLFRGYCFVAVRAQWSPAAYAPGVSHLIGSRGAPPDEVPDTLVAAIKSREDRAGYVRLPRAPSKRSQRSALRPGDRVASPVVRCSARMAWCTGWRRTTASSFCCARSG